METNDLVWLPKLKPAQMVAGIEDLLAPIVNSTPTTPPAANASGF